MQNDLANVEWREFKISEIFRNYHGKRLIEKQRTKGKVPLLTAGESNNGIASFIGNKAVSYENFISIDMFGNSFYHPYEACGDDNIYFFLNKEISKYVKIFFVCCINRQKSKYSYGKQFRQKNADNCKIMLPIDSKGNPNWHFMESYMKAIEKEHLEKITTYYNAKLAEADSWGGGFDLDEYKDFIKQGKSKSIQWKEFYFADIFKEIKRGKRLIKDDQIQGKTPYVSSSAFNNGVDNFIDNYENVRKFSDCISLANSGSVGSAFFHSYEFIASDHVTQLIQPKFSKYIYLFLLPIIARLSEKYSFNREINDKRIKREKLLLPMDTKGNPNWQFMENYTRNIEYKKISNAVDYYQKKIK